MASPVQLIYPSPSLAINNQKHLPTSVFTSDKTHTWTPRLTTTTHHIEICWWSKVAQTVDFHSSGHATHFLAYSCTFFSPFLGAMCIISTKQKHKIQTQNTNTLNDANKLVYYPSTSRGDRFSGTFVSHTIIIYRTSLGLTVSQFSQMRHRNFPYPCAYFVICSTPRAVPQHAHHKSRALTIREVWKHNGGGRGGGFNVTLRMSLWH